MKNSFKFRPQTLTLIPALLAVSACSPTSPTGFSAGAPSEHTPQSYEKTSSTAASTSTLGGSASVLVALSGADTAESASSAAVTGSVTHDTGRIELDDGTYLFIDADGFDGSGNLSDGAGATGSRTDVSGASFAGSYDYVVPFLLRHKTTGRDHLTLGVAGLITASSDMPSGGSAVYTGESWAYGGAAGSEYGYGSGTSTVSVNFGAGTANVVMGGFSVHQSGTAVTAADAPLDQIKGTGLVISGAHFTGGNWVTLKNGAVVNVVGAGAVTTSNGTFFGYDSSISGPDEVAGVVTSVSSTGFLSGVYIAD